MKIPETDSRGRSDLQRQQIKRRCREIEARLIAYQSAWIKEDQARVATLRAELATLLKKAGVSDPLAEALLGLHRS